MIRASFAQSIFEHEGAVAEAFLSCVRPHDSFLDVGAHIGDYAAEVRKKTNGVIVMVEPNPLCGAKILEREIPPPTMLVSAMAWQENGRPQSFMIPYGSWDKIPEVEYGCGGASMTPGDCRHGAAEILVPTLGIDTLLSLVERGFDLVKIDIEGGEFEASRGAHNVFSRARVILVEIHHSNLEATVSKRRVELLDTELRSYLKSAGLELKQTWPYPGNDKRHELWERK